MHILNVCDCPKIIICSFFWHQTQHSASASLTWASNRKLLLLILWIYLSPYCSFNLSVQPNCIETQLQCIKTIEADFLWWQHCNEVCNSKQQSLPYVRRTWTQIHTDKHLLYSHGQGLIVCKISTPSLIKRDFLQCRYSGRLLPCCVSTACTLCMAMCVYVGVCMYRMTWFFTTFLAECFSQFNSSWKHCCYWLSDGSRTAGSIHLAVAQSALTHGDQ